MSAKIKTVTFDEHIAANKAAFSTSNHRWKQRDPEDGGGIDWFADAGGYCNGPVCEDCGYHRCVHCNAGDAIPPCPAARKERRQ